MFTCVYSVHFKSQLPINLQSTPQFSTCKDYLSFLRSIDKLATQIIDLSFNKISIMSKHKDEPSTFILKPKNSLQEEFIKYFEAGLYTDCSIAAKCGAKMELHRAVLASHSEYLAVSFRAIFGENTFHFKKK